MEATASVVTSMPPQQRSAALQQMLAYLVVPLQQAVQAKDEALSVLLVDRLTVVFRRARSSQRRGPDVRGAVPPGGLPILRGAGRADPQRCPCAMAAAGHPALHGRCWGQAGILRCARHSPWMRGEDRVHTGGCWCAGMWTTHRASRPRCRACSRSWTPILPPSATRAQPASRWAAPACSLPSLGAACHLLEGDRNRSCL